VLKICNISVGKQVVPDDVIRSVVGASIRRRLIRYIYAWN